MASFKDMNSPARFPDNLPKYWKKLLSAEQDKDYFVGLSKFLKNEYRTKQTVFPPQDKILLALQELDYPDVKIVILGQDPYHGPGQAIGRSFGVPNDLRLKPPSLQNIFKEIASDLKLDMQGKGSDLSGWAQQGILLLNTVLTVRASEAFSHRKQGWEQFTDQIIGHLNQREDPVVFILWGSPARSKKELITHKRHPILESAHPSPLSAARGFFGCRHFSISNDYLSKLDKTPIDWSRTSL
jgi:uracil-DNA glycosylase